MPRRAPSGGRHRRGVALLAALGLLLLAAALLAGSAVASVELGRATRSLVAGARASAESRRALGEVVQQWDAGLDSLPIGAVVDRPVAPPEWGGLKGVARARVRRLTSRLFSVGVTVQVGDTEAAIAVRRARLLLERGADSGAGGTAARVRPLARWSLVDLH